LLSPTFWHAVRVSESVTAGPAEWVNLPDLSEKLDVSISKVNQMVRDGHLLAVRRDGIRVVPAELVANATVLKHLPGVLNLLRDAGYNDEEALRWLYEPDKALGGTAAAALGGPLAREVKRRAQAVGF
jgi:hypothetical protein